MCNVWWISTGEIQVFIRNIDRHISLLFSNNWLGNRWNNYIVLFLLKFLCELFSLELILLLLFPSTYNDLLEIYKRNKYYSVTKHQYTFHNAYNFFNRHKKILRLLDVIHISVPHEPPTWASHVRLQREPHVVSVDSQDAPEKFAICWIGNIG